MKNSFESLGRFVGVLFLTLIGGLIIVFSLMLIMQYKSFAGISFAFCSLIYVKFLDLVFTPFVRKFWETL